jgi:hypothetical protein
VTRAEDFILLVPFVSRFPELGQSETRVATFLDVREIPEGKYSFLELYCDDEACDCRRVIIQVIRECPEPEVVATINYGWEEPEFYTNWMGSDDEESEMSGAILEPLLQQTRHSPFFLTFFREMLRRDPAYDERLKRHYAMFKAAPPPRTRSWQTPHSETRAKRPKLAPKRKRSR